MKITRRQLRQMILETMDVTVDDDTSKVPTSQSSKLREPWDGIDELGKLILQNSIKIAYLADQLDIDIPVDIDLNFRRSKVEKK